MRVQARAALAPTFAPRSLTLAARRPLRGHITKNTHGPRWSASSGSRARWRTAPVVFRIARETHSLRAGRCALRGARTEGARIMPRLSGMPSGAGLPRTDVGRRPIRGTAARCRALSAVSHTTHTHTHTHTTPTDTFRREIHRFVRSAALAQGAGRRPCPAPAPRGTAAAVSVAGRAVSGQAGENPTPTGHTNIHPRALKARGSAARAAVYLTTHVTHLTCVHHLPERK